jgi:hypothetical protein
MAIIEAKYTLNSTKKLIHYKNKIDLTEYKKFLQFRLKTAGTALQ